MNFSLNDLSVFVQLAVMLICYVAVQPLRASIDNLGKVIERLEIAVEKQTETIVKHGEEIARQSEGIKSAHKRINDLVEEAEKLRQRITELEKDRK